MSVTDLTTLVEVEPDHPIIERPWEYRVIGLDYQIPLDESPPYLDLTLAKGDSLRRLRFLWPRDLHIERGFPARTGGMQIVDVSARGLEGIRVWVRDIEASPGAVEFWAAEVIDLDSPPEVP
ncbi:MAG: hypothetical protein ACK47B_17460 [Armatimonadota bacterium]